MALSVQSLHGRPPTFLPRLLLPLISSPYSLVRLVQVGNRSVIAAAFVSGGVENLSSSLTLARSVPHLHQVNSRILGEKGSSLIGFGSSIRIQDTGYCREKFFSPSFKNFW